jgi:hypothetical protein
MPYFWSAGTVGYAQFALKVFGIVAAIVHCAARASPLSCTSSTGTTSWFAPAPCNSPQLSHRCTERRSASVAYPRSEEGTQPQRSEQ